MAFVDLKWQKKREKWNFGFFDKFQYIYVWETVCRTEKYVKQKMQGAKSFVAMPSAKRGDGKKKKKRIRALSLTIPKLLLKNLNSLSK